MLATERALRGQARPARHIPCPQRDRVPARAAETLSRKPASRVRTARTRRDASGEAAPMLSRPGLPSGSGWSFELKWDGFRAIVSTEDQLRVRSRRGWNMTTALPELRGLPGGLVLDGELVAWKGSEPYFPHVCRRVLNWDMSIPLTFVVFDLLRLEGTDVTERPYSERRRLLEGLDLNSSWWRTGDTFSDGDALYCCVRNGARGRGREEAVESLPPERSRMGKGQESELLASRRRTRCDGAEARAAKSELRLASLLRLVQTVRRAARGREYADARGPLVRECGILTAGARSPRRAKTRSPVLIMSRPAQGPAPKEADGPDCLANRSRQANNGPIHRMSFLTRGCPIDPSKEMAEGARCYVATLERPWGQEEFTVEDPEGNRLTF